MSASANADRRLVLDELCYALKNTDKERHMHINTKMRIAALLYLMAAYAVALPAIALFTDLVINGGIIDMWKGRIHLSTCLSGVKCFICSLPGWALFWALSTGCFSLENTAITIHWINILSNYRRCVWVFPCRELLRETLNQSQKQRRCRCSIRWTSASNGDAFRPCARGYFPWSSLRIISAPALNACSLPVATRRDNGAMPQLVEG